MVLSLNDLCLLRVCNFMIDGILPNNLQTVSVSLRRLIFETLVERDKLSDPVCLRYMKDLLFDDSFCAVQAIPKLKRRFQSSNLNAYSGFLQFLKTQFENVPGLVDRITTLRLLDKNPEVPRDETISMGGKDYTELTKDFSMVLKLVSQCRNLKHLSVANGSYEAYKCNKLLHLLADAVQCSGSSGLDTLELACRTIQHCIFNPTPEQMLPFKRLKYLRLEHVRLSQPSWKRLLDCCHETLENLVLDRICLDSGDLVPIRLDEVRSLNIADADEVLNLSTVAERCPKLKSCHFMLEQSDLNLGSIPALRAFLSSLEDCSVNLVLHNKQSLFLDDLTDAVGDKITRLKFCCNMAWTESVHRLVLGCPNLYTVEVFDWRRSISNTILEKILRCLFCDKERAAKLLRLRLNVALSEEMLDQLFANCINVKVLELSGNNARPSDNHLQVWIERGARPSLVHLESSLISGRGLKVLIEACGTNLTSLSVGDCYPEEIGSAFKALMHCCPFLEFISVPGVSELARAYRDKFSRSFFCRLID